MKLNENFITHQSNDRQVMVSLDRKRFSGLVRSNQTAADIIDLLKEEISKQEIIDQMRKKYEVTEDVITEDVNKVIDVLRSIGAIDE